MSDLKFFCPECGQKIVCDAQYIGSRIPCPTCQKTFVVSSSLSLPPIGQAAEPGTPGVAAPAAAAAVAAPPTANPFTAPAAPPPMRTISPPLPSHAEPAVKTPAVVDVNRYSGLAIASLVCSVFVPLGFIPGLICGHMAKKRMQKDVFLEGEKMANTGLAISYCVLAAWLLFGIVGLGVRWYHHPSRTVLASGDAPFGPDYRIVDQFTVDKTEDDHGEDDHSLEQRGNSQKTLTADLEGRRVSRGGSFSYTLKVLPDQAMSLVCRYWGSEAKGRLFDIAVDSQIIATQSLGHNVPEKFFDEEYKIPPALTQGKNEVTVEFRAHPNLTAGTLYGCAILKQ